MVRLEAPGLICLGASAGGLRSLEAIVSRLRSDLPWPVLISQHLQADRVSEMPAILARVAAMPVREAVDGETPMAGTIYTCPASSEMGLTFDGQIALRAPIAGRPQRIDHLFSTASYARPDRTIAVVLSGTGNDGALGSLVVKLNGGTVIAESDASAQHLAMPAAAQRAGTVDATLSADNIAPLLADLAQGGLDEATAATRSVLADIAKTLQTATGTEFTHYRSGTLRRQAEKRRAILGLATLGDYRKHLADDPNERDALVSSLLIPVTEFFRDPPTWRALEELVIPALVERATAGRPVRIWCAGCATGEEAYTIAMLILEKLDDTRNIHMLATDLDASAIAAAVQGTYDGTRMDCVDASRRERFFQAGERGGYRVSDELHKLVQFRVHDVTQDVAPGRFDLIICRNLLIYFDDELQAKTLTMFREALAAQGMLVLGRSEAILSHAGEFTPVSRTMRIFRATGPGSTDGDDFAEQDTPSPDAEGSYWSGASGVRVEEPDALVLLVDDDRRIMRANEHALRALGDDILGKDLLDVFPRWQGSPVHDALRSSSATGRSLKVRGAPTPEGPMDITLERPTDGEHGTLVIGTPAAGRGSAALDDHDVRDELAATHSELQSTNEELAATNEELQATNEELATLNEEFQSTNQTLASTNVELGAVARTTREAADLMAEFLQSWKEAIVACDASQRVTMFNRKAADLLDLDASCLGRPVTAALGESQPEVEVWLEHAQKAPFSASVDHKGRALAVTVEHVKGHAGNSLGWVLSWAPGPTPTS